MSTQQPIYPALLVSAVLVAYASPALAETLSQNNMQTTTVTSSDSAQPQTTFNVENHGNGTVSITGYNGTNSTVVIPATIGTLTVTSISKGAFKGKGITNIIIPPTVRTIGDEAFANNSISILDLPTSVTTIGSSAFANNSIVSLSLHDQLVNLGDYAFASNSITSLKLPTSLSNIPKGAFEKNKLITLTLHDKITTIQDRAFADNSIVTISIPKSVSYVGSESFRNNKITSLYIPSSVQSSSMDAFLNNPLDNVTIPERLKGLLMGVPNTNSMYNLYLYEDSKDPGKTTLIPESEKKKQQNQIDLSSLTNQQVLSLGLVGGQLAITKPKFNMNGFGNIKVTDKPVTVSLSLASDIIVSDLRGTLEGWHLTVSATPLTEVAKKGGTAPKGGWFKLPTGTLAIAQPDLVYEVDGKGNAIATTELSAPTANFSNGYAVVDNGAVTVLSAPAEKGNGIWGLRFPKDALVLTVSPKTARVDKDNYPNSPTPYTTTITWNLTSGPGTSNAVKQPTNKTSN